MELQRKIAFVLGESIVSCFRVLSCLTIEPRWSNFYVHPMPNIELQLKFSLQSQYIRPLFPLLDLDDIIAGYFLLISCRPI